jgi:hypothetical protein
MWRCARRHSRASSGGPATKAERFRSRAAQWNTNANALAVKREEEEEWGKKKWR